MTNIKKEVKKLNDAISLVTSSNRNLTKNEESALYELRPLLNTAKAHLLAVVTFLEVISEDDTGGAEALKTKNLTSMH